MSMEPREPSRPTTSPPIPTKPRHLVRKIVVISLAAFGALSAAFFISSMFYFNSLESATLEALAEARAEHPNLFLGIPEDDDPWLQLTQYDLIKAVILAKDSQPERLQEGQSIFTAQLSLGAHPVLVEEFISAGKQFKQIAWKIEPDGWLVANFLDNELTKWDWADTSEEEPAPALAESEVYPMSADAQIRGTVLDFWVEDLFDYYGAQFAISSGQDLYFYELQLLSGGEVTSIELTEFSNEGRRFSPYSYVVDGLAVVATRPDGAKARFSTAFTGDMRKQK